MSEAVPHIGRPFLLGVNYWPRAKAMGWWADFDAGEVREELAMIADLGLGIVRVFLLWESFQPRPDEVSDEALGHLRTVADLAADSGLLLEPTFFTGHMSGPNWAPDWLLDPSRPLHPGDRQIVSLGRRSAAAHDIHDPHQAPFVLEAERLQLRTVCSALADHPALWAWSLGNEPDLLARPSTADAGRAWMADMVRTIREVDPDHPVLIGLHAASIHGNVGLRIDHAAAETDISVMHGYSIYDPLAREPLDPELVPFTAALTAALANRPVLYEEFGVNTRVPDGPSDWRELVTWDGGTRRAYFASEADAADHYSAVLDGLHRAGCLGAFAWSFGDYAPHLWDRPPCDLQEHERFFGLYRADGSLKPMGAAVRDFAATSPTIRSAERTLALGVTPDAFYADPARYLPGLYADWLRR
ncbi:MAG: glycoside hydrolase 5 family protein [Candidatus Limnocylindria bacterium]